MLKTIDGITYNTATAREVAHFSDGRPLGDPLHVFDTLYRSNVGWFVHRRRGGEESIIPFTPQEAQGWLKEKNFIGALAQHFGQRVKRTPASVL